MVMAGTTTHDRFIHDIAAKLWNLCAKSKAMGWRCWRRWGENPALAGDQYLQELPQLWTHHPGAPLGADGMNPMPTWRSCVSNRSIPC